MLRRPPGRVVVQHATAAGTSMEEHDDGCEQRVRAQRRDRGETGRGDETRGGRSVGRADDAAAGTCPGAACAYACSCGTDARSCTYTGTCTNTCTWQSM